MNNKIPIIFSLVVLIIILLAIPLTLYLVRQEEKQEVPVRAAAETALSISPASTTELLNENFNINVMVNTGGNNIFGGDLRLSFDPKVLEVQDIQAGGFLTEPQEIKKSIDNTNGTITYVLGSFSTNQGSGALAVLNFNAVGAGTSQIRFETGTSVASEGEAEGLASTENGSIAVAESVSLNFQIKFEGIDSQGPNKNVRVILKQGNLEKYRFDSVAVTADQNGVYSGTITGIDPDTYDIYFKEQSHLQTKFANINLSAMQNNQDWTGSELLTADADGNNVINIQDFRVLVETFDQEGDNLAADFNGNRKVDIQDFIFIKINYDLVGD